jgi:hypothetical protein
LPQFVSKTPTGGRIIGSLSEVRQAMYHSILSYRGSQHQSQKTNINQSSFRCEAIAAQNPKIFDAWLKRHENDVFSSPSGNQDIK